MVTHSHLPLTDKETWFVSYQTFPLETAIRLGQLISDPGKPDDRVGSGPLAISAHEKLFTGVTKKDVQFQKEITRGFGLGFSATVLSLLPFGVGGDTEKGTTHRFEIKKVEEKLFDPSLDYVQKSVLQPDVLAYLAKNNYRKAVYMIVGIRIGHDATISHGKNTKVGGNINATVPGAVIGVPLEIGANAKASRDNKTHQQESIPNDFVFAYRLREVRYSKKAQSATSSLYTKAAELHDANAPRPPSQIQKTAPSFSWTANEIVVDGIAGKDFSMTPGEGLKVVDGCIMIP